AASRLQLLAVIEQRIEHRARDREDVSRRIGRTVVAELRRRRGRDDGDIRILAVAGRVLFALERLAPLCARLREARAARPEPCREGARGLLEERQRRALAALKEID